MASLAHCSDRDRRRRGGRERASSLARNAAAATSASSTAAPRAIGFADLPPPKTSSPEALKHFLSAMRDLHDATTQSQTELFAAVRLDPTFAAAQLRLALIQGMPGARKPMREAVRYRQSLDARDQAILDAEAPVLFVEPEDWQEARRRLEALHAARPTSVRDPLLAVSRPTLEGPRGRAREPLARAFELDPRPSPPPSPTSVSSTRTRIDGTSCTRSTIGGAFGSRPLPRGAGSAPRASTARAAIAPRSPKRFGRRWQSTARSSSSSRPSSPR